MACDAVGKLIPEDVADLDVIADRTSGLMRIEFSSPETAAKSALTIDYAEDSSCGSSPALQSIIDQYRVDMADIDAQECKAVTALLNSAATHVDGMPIDPDGLKRYQAELCT